MAHEGGSGRWSDDAAISHLLLGEDAVAIVAALKAAIRISNRCQAWWKTVPVLPRDHFKGKRISSAFLRSSTTGVMR
jgi:hypothetical protein